MREWWLGIPPVGPETGQPMRTVKKLYLLFPFLMVLVLLCGQLPELLTLTDDISNDFEEESLAYVPEGLKVTTSNAISRRGIVFEQESKRIVPIKPFTQLVPFSPPELLPLLSIQRE